MRLARARFVLCGALLSLAACSQAPKVVERSPEFRWKEPLTVAMLEVYDRFGGFDARRLQDELARRMTEIGFKGRVAGPSDRPAGDWSPARAALAAQELKADAALVTSVVSSDLPTFAPVPHGSFTLDTLEGPVWFSNPYVPGRWFIASVALIEAGTGRVVFRAAMERQLPGYNERKLASLLLQPLED